MERWAGRTAVVTGAGGGIGSAIAATLANIGLNVVGIDRRPLTQELMSTVNGAGTLHSRICDVSNPEEVAVTFKWIEQTFGGTDVLVNNAAVVYHGSITELGPHPVTVEEMMLQVDVNVKSVALCARHAAKSMQDRGSQGHIININSVIGHYISPQPIFNLYCPSKHAVTAITHSLRVEFSTFKANIKTSSVSPGMVKTDMFLASKIPELREILKLQPSLQPQDVADAVLYLLSTPTHVNIEELTIAAVGDIRI